MYAFLENVFKELSVDSKTVFFICIKREISDFLTTLKGIQKYLGWSVLVDLYHSLSDYLFWQEIDLDALKSRKSVLTIWGYA